jgi:uncharacterized protein YndB with AHSA1/START domain
MAAPAERVFDVLSNGWTYSDWVVGTAHVRDVDETWPRPGTALHHQAGPWPLSVRDRSTVLSCEEPHRLTLRAGLWPLGHATVAFTLTPLGPRTTRVTLAEDLAAGPLGWAGNRATELLLSHRNRETLKRLADVVTRHSTGWAR